MKVSFQTEHFEKTQHVYDLFVECRRIFDIAYGYSIMCLSFDSDVPFCLSLSCYDTPQEAFEMVDKISKKYPHIDCELDGSGLSSYPEFNESEI